MVKILSISLSDHIWETYLSEIKANNINMSRYLEKLIILGSQSMIGEKETQESKILAAYQKIHALEEELNQLKAKYGKLKTKLQYKDQTKTPEFKKKLSIARGIRNNNPLARMD